MYLHQELFSRKKYSCPYDSCPRWVLYCDSVYVQWPVFWHWFSIELSICIFTNWWPLSLLLLVQSVILLRIKLYTSRVIIAFVCSFALW